MCVHISVVFLIPFSPSSGPPTQHFRRYFVGETEFDRHCNVLICCRVWLVAVPFKNCLDMNVFLKYIWPKWMLCIWNREFGSDPEKCMLKMFASFQTNRFFFWIGMRCAMFDVHAACHHCINIWYLELVPLVFAFGYLMFRQVRNQESGATKIE